MSLRTLSAIAAVTTAVLFSAAASAAAPGDTDLGCSYASTTDPGPEAPDNTRIAEVDGGPIAGNGTNGVTILSPAVVSYTARPFETVYLCSAFHDGSTSWVYDDVDGTWKNSDTSPAAECSLSIDTSSGIPVIDPFFDLLDGACGLVSSQCPPDVCDLGILCL